MTFNITPSSSIFKHIILSDTLHNSTTLSTCSFFNMIPTPFFLFPLPQYHILYPPSMHLALSPFQRVSCTHRLVKTSNVKNCTRLMVFVLYTVTADRLIQFFCCKRDKITTGEKIFNSFYRNIISCGTNE